MPVISENLNLKTSKQRWILRSEGLDKILKLLALTLIRSYQIVLSPILGGACRFYPTCSAYGTEAFATHDAKKAFILTLKRLAKCQPFGKKGFDPVPENLNQKPPTDYKKANNEFSAQ